MVRSPLLAAALSFLIPGLGQAAVGKPRRGGVIAIPFLATPAVLLLIVLLLRGKTLDAAVNQQWLTNLLIVDLILLACHAWAVIDAYVLASRNVPKAERGSVAGRKWAATFGIGIILTGTVGVHAGLASFDLTLKSNFDCVSSPTGDCMFGSGPTLQPGQTIAMPSDDNQVVVDPSDSAGASTPVPTPTGAAGTFDPSQLPANDVPADARQWADDGQLNVLLAGIDAGSGGGRNAGLRPDTMIVLHVDLASGKAAMIGIPRNTQCVPLPQAIAAHYAKNSNGCPGYTYPNMLNWLANDAGWNRPTWFPFYQGSSQAYVRAMTATQVAIETLTGLNIDGFAVINLEGLVKIINDMGGINITVPKNLTAYDGPCGVKGSWAAKYRVCGLNPPHAGYPISNPSVIPQMIADAAKSGGKQTITAQVNNGYAIGFVIKAGDQHMSGDWALAYARTRIYTTDYNRMMRQQLVLKAMRTTLNPCALLPRVPDLIKDVGSAFWTNLPLTDASKWAGLAQHVLGANVKSITLDPSTLGNANSTFINPTTWAKAKSIVAHSLDSVPAADSSGGSSGGGGGTGFNC